MTAEKRKLYAVMTLPFPPSLNHYWRCAHGRFYISDEGKAYNNRVRLYANVPPLSNSNVFKIQRNYPVSKKLELAVVCHFYFSDNRRQDLDNLFKVLFDSMTKAGVWLDDSQVFEIAAKKYLKRQHQTTPRVEMEVYVIHDPEGIPDV